MAEHYTDEDVERAVKATRRVRGGTIVGLLVENEVRMALDAVAPAIAARALREFAETLLEPTPGYLSDGGTCRYFHGVAIAAADEIERKR